MSRRFVVQTHTVAPGDVHYDLMIEDRDVLVTFQLEAPPEGPVAGRRSFDHRPRYLDYEGPIGGGRGEVAIWDRGVVVDVAGTPRSPRYLARFAGDRLAGLHELTGSPAEGEGVKLERVAGDERLRA